MRIVEMTPEYARMISGWKYDGEYAFYDHSEEHSDGLLDGTHFACVDAQEELIGYFCYGDDARIPTIEEDVYPDGYLDFGLGLRPDLCGKGNGSQFLKFGLEYARVHYKADRFRLSVAAFNKRAIKVYQKAGFRERQIVTNSYFHNAFYLMTCGDEAGERG